MPSLESVSAREPPTDRVTETRIWPDRHGCLVDDDLLRVSLAETKPLMAHPEMNRWTAASSRSSGRVPARQACRSGLAGRPSA